jgi:hypothetical protein
MERRAVFFKPRCKLWRCPVCSEINRSRWIARAYHGAEVLIAEGSSVDFLTLTSHEKLDADKTVIVFKHAWDMLNKRARRVSPAYQYLLVPERHEDGRLHAHLLETSHLKERWWKDNARECGLGYEVKKKILEGPPHAAFYVGKYLGKQLGEKEWPEGFRHVRVSRHWPTLPELETLIGWEWGTLPKREMLQDKIDHYTAMGYACVIAGSHSAWEYVTDGVMP